MPKSQNHLSPYAKAKLAQARTYQVATYLAVAVLCTNIMFLFWLVVQD